MERLLFTSESVTEGHPDKICDQISDAVLDALLEQDPMSRVACETAITTGLVLVMGEITTNAYVDIQKLVRETIDEIGCRGAALGAILGLRGGFAVLVPARRSFGRAAGGLARS